MIEQEKEQYNEDELCAPKWMDQDFFQKILRASNSDNSIDVSNVVITPGSKAGDHYASVMFRADLNYSAKGGRIVEQSLIVKAMPFADGPKKDLLEGMNMFDIEIQMYKEVLPKFENMLKIIGDDTQLSGKCIHAGTEPFAVLIFEDLTKEKYKTVTNWGGSWEIGKKAVEKLAKWHALSFKLVSEGDYSLQNFTSNGFTDGNLLETPLFKFGFKNFVDMLRKEKELQQYLPKFESLLSEDPLSKSIAALKAFRNGE